MLNSGFVIELLFDRRGDGRFHVHSPHVPGLHLAGRDLDAIKLDVEPVLKDLLLHNSGMVVDEIEWVPSLEEIVEMMKGGMPPPRPEPPSKTNFLLIRGHAAHAA
jgi:hypothetical protein